MTFAIFKGESSMKDLVTRLFNMPKTSSKAAASKATDELSAVLIKANPQLSDLTKVPPGSRIAIPETAPPLNPGQQVSPQLSRRAAIATQALQSLAAASQQFAQASSQAVDTANSVLKIAQSQQTKELAGSDSNLKQQLPNLVKSLKTTVKQVPTMQEAQGKTVAAIITRLQAMAIK